MLVNRLHQVLAAETHAWREAGYPCEQYPVIGEVLDWQTDPQTGGLRYLRTAELRALEVCWYLRAVMGTPHVFETVAKVISLARESTCLVLPQTITSEAIAPNLLQSSGHEDLAVRVAEYLLETLAEVTSLASESTSPVLRQPVCCSRLLSCRCLRRALSAAFAPEGSRTYHVSGFSLTSPPAVCIRPQPLAFPARPGPNPARAGGPPRGGPQHHSGLPREGTGRRLSD